MKAVQRIESDIPRPVAIMRAYHGHGPEGAYCKTCRHLRHFRASSKRWTKCAQTTDTGGPGSDWSVSWPACALYEPVEMPKALFTDQEDEQTLDAMLGATIRRLEI